MPISIINRKFYDYKGNGRSFYRADVGDYHRVNINIDESVMVTSGASAYLQLNPIDNIITWSGGDWETEGFCQGDIVRCIKYTSGGGMITDWYATIQAINQDELDIDSCPTWIDQQNGEIFRIYKVFPRQGLLIDINHVPNGQVGNEFSQIDGEVTRWKFDLTTFSVGGAIYGTPVGKQSGQHVIMARLIWDSDNNGVRSYILTIDYLVSPINFPTLFNNANCQKLYIKQTWESILGNPNNVTVYIDSHNGDTGWFDEPFNTGSVISYLVQGVNSIDYQNESYFSVIVECPFGELGIGSCYVPQDEAYYKHRTYPQSFMSMNIGTTQIWGAGMTISSFNNEFGAYYQIEILNVNNIGGQQYQLDLRFMPSQDFADFMEGRDDGDRSFKLWIRADDTNLLVFDDQLTKVLPVGDKLKFEQEKFLYHNQNYVETTNSSSGCEANIEDDVAFTGAFQIPYFSQCDGLSASIISRNGATDEEFTLNSVNFSFDQIPMLLGKYQLNEVAPVVSTLPTTSLKQNALLYLDPPYNNANDEYGVRIYYPFLFRWEDWLSQPNASNDFYPNKTKNWYPYDSTTDWQLELKIVLTREGLTHEYRQGLKLKNYDTDPNIFQEIELILDSTNQSVGVITEGMLMRVKATHTIMNGMAWDIDNTWGMITIEPTESSPRWISSTIVPFDNNTSNPLTPLSGLYCDLQIVGPVAIMECYFDPNQINLENGCKFTTKIKGCFVTPIGKQKSDGTIKQKSDGIIKVKAE
jgi:hypothetical protein